MATPTLDARLKLNTSEFDTNLEKSKKQVGKFRKDTDTAGKGIQEMFKSGIAMAGGFGAALVGVNGVAGAFKTLLDSNQKYGDNFAVTMEGCKSVFNDFVTHLANKDLSAFSANIANAYKAGVEKGKADDQLGNTRMSYNFAVDNKRAKIEDINAQLTKTKDDNERGKLIAERANLIADLKSMTGVLSGDVLSSLSTGVNAALSGVFKGDVTKMFTEDMFIKSSEVDLNKDTRDQTKADADAFYQQFLKRANPLLKEIYSLDDDIAERKKNMAISSTPLQRANLAKAEVEKSKYENELSQYINSLGETEKQHLLNYVTLFRYSDEQLQNVFSTLQGVFQSQRYVSKLDKQPIPAYNSGGSGSGSGSNKDKINVKVYVDGEVDDNYDYERLDSSYEGQRLNENDKRKNSYSQALINSSSFSDINKPFEFPELNTLDIDDNITQFSNLASAIGSVTGAVNEGASGWISWGASLLAAIGTALPAITALTTAKEAEANANAKAAVTGAASSVASIPAVGWIMAGAAVASVIAAMVSVPKFASGGIVPGASYSGDKIPALLNSGEMVLNSRQQSNLFYQLDRGTSGNVNVTGEFRINGTDLVAAVKKNNDINDRI